MAGVILANARERAVPRPKSDGNDAQWLQRLHALAYRLAVTQCLRGTTRPAGGLMHSEPNWPSPKGSLERAAEFGYMLKQAESVS